MVRETQNSAPLQRRATNNTNPQRHDNFTRAVSRRYRDRGQEIGKYCPLPEPIRLQDSQGTARSRSNK